MSGAGLLAGIVVLTLVLSLTLKKDAPVIAFLLVLAAGVVLLLRLGEAAQSTMQRFSALLARGNLDARAVPGRCCASSASRFSCASSRRSAAMQASPRLRRRWSLPGRWLAFGAALPLLEQVLTFLTEWTV